MFQQDILFLIDRATRLRKCEAFSKLLIPFGTNLHIIEKTIQESRKSRESLEGLWYTDIIVNENSRKELGRLQNHEQLDGEFTKCNRVHRR